ncbi:MAG: hypoxanthine phosphoribosyltransferase [Clostridia bacterium]|nr:hypoxanthine phosphoribosyltransferase [Clostridia bacterium]
MYADLECILLTEEELKAGIRRLGETITRDYAGKEPLLVCTLKGAVNFFADLIREIDLPLAVDFIAASSYKGTESTGKVNIRKDVDADIAGRDVLIVEDIIDTGITLNNLKTELLKRKPASLKIVTLLDKPGGRQSDLEPDYACFTIPDGFVVGYGLDYNEKYRNLPDIGILARHIYEKEN